MLSESNTSGSCPANDELSHGRESAGFISVDKVGELSAEGTEEASDRLSMLNNCSAETKLMKSFVMRMRELSC